MHNHMIVGTKQQRQELKRMRFLFGILRWSQANNDTAASMRAFGEAWKRATWVNYRPRDTE